METSVWPMVGSHCFMGGEEQSDAYPGMMIIGHIEDQYLATVATFGSSINIVIEEA